MRLLVDENISWRLKRSLPQWDILPANEITSTSKITDTSIWQYAKTNNYTILTFDEDFVELHNLNSYPPKIVWLRMGNVTTQEIAQRLIQLQTTLIGFIEDSDSGVLEIY